MAPKRHPYSQLSDSAKYYRNHPEAREKKKQTDKKINSRPEQKEKRRELSRKNREHDKKYGKDSRRGKDLSHTSAGLKYKESSTNRGSKKDTQGDKNARG